MAFIYPDFAAAHRYPKSWGYEDWIANSPEYCGKLLHFEGGGKSTSMHFHLLKDETMYLRSGRVIVEMIDPETAERYACILTPGDTLHIPRGQPHRLVGAEESDLFEFSTQHFESDSYRVEKGR